MSQKLVSVLPEDGLIFGANDITPGEYSGSELSARNVAYDDAFKAAYKESTSSMDFSGRDATVTTDQVQKIQDHLED